MKSTIINMDQLPIDIIAQIFNKSDISSMLAWVMAAVKIPQNVKNLLINTKKLSWIQHTIADKNDAMCKFLIDIGWENDINCIYLAAQYSNHFAIDVLQFIEVNNYNELVKILCHAFKSGNIYTAKYVIERYNIKEIDVCDSKELFININDNVELTTHPMFDFIWRQYPINAHKAAKRGFAKIFERYIQYIDNNIIYTAIRGGNLDIIERIHILRPGLFNQHIARLAVVNGNISVLGKIIQCGCTITNYVELQLAAVNEKKIDMFKFVYKLNKIKDIAVSGTIFGTNNIELMQYIHKHNWPICFMNGVSLTGTKYMHEKMNCKLDPELYFAAIAKNELMPFVEYLINNNTYPTKDIFSKIIFHNRSYDEWMFMHKAKKLAKRSGVWK